MCGLFGIFSPNHNGYHNIGDSLKHRGPDQCGTWQDDHIFLHHTRLSILDLSGQGRQPMADPSGRYVIVYNGEVYNFKDIRRSLERKGVGFATGTDTEVVLQTYITEGIEGFEAFRGMFAFAIYDKQKRRLILARDRFGIKPLLYSRTEQGLAFSSELKPLVRCGWLKSAINPQALSGLFRYGAVPQPDCIYSAAYHVAPGSVTEIDSAFRVSTFRFCPSIEDTPAIREDMDYKAAVRELRGLLEDVTKLNLTADVDVGCFLSGGVDSTAVLAMMNRHQDKPIKAFSIGFEPGDEVPDESEIAARSAEALGASFEKIVIRDEEIGELFRDFVRMIDQPSIDGFNTYLVSRVAAGHTKVALSGLGGDEIFAGYPHFRTLSMTAGQKKKWFDRFGYYIHKLRPNRWTLPVAMRYSGPYHGTDIQRSMASPVCLKRMLKTVTSPRQEKCDEMPWSPVQAVSVHELTHYMKDTLLRDTDIVGMAHSLEIRPVLLDHRLLSFALSLPDRFKCDETRLKKIFVDSVRDIIPEEVIARSKTGFELPYAMWLNGPLNGFMQEIWRHERARDIFRNGYIKAMLKKAHMKKLSRSDWLSCVTLSWYIDRPR